MITSKSFQFHEPDNQIMVKKDRVEIMAWMDDLRFVGLELEYLIGLENQLLEDRQLFQQLYGIKSENHNRLAELVRYETVMSKAVECDTTECDSFFLYQHEKNRETFQDHIKKYRHIKISVLSKIMDNTK